MEFVICQVLILVTGNIGAGAATLGVMGVGAGAIMGKVSMSTAVTVAVGISILFSCRAIAGAIGLGSNC